MPKYAVSRDYLPLVTVSYQASIPNLILYGARAVLPRWLISSEEILALANSKETMLVFDSLPEAKVAAISMVQGHNTTPDFIAKGVAIFASPVIFTYEDTKLKGTEEKKEVLSANVLENYARPNNIPLMGPHEKICVFPEEFELATRNLTNSQPAKYTLQKMHGVPSAALYFSANLNLCQAPLWQIPMLRYATMRVSI